LDSLSRCFQSVEDGQIGVHGDGDAVQEINTLFVGELALDVALQGENLQDDVSDVVGPGQGAALTFFDDQAGPRVPGLSQGFPLS